MKRLIAILGVLAAVIAAVLGIGPRVTSGTEEAAARGLTTREKLELFDGRVRLHPNDAVSLALVGRFQAQLARETGDISLLFQAEETLDHSLVLLPGYPPARASLASIYFSEHRFQEALDLATAVYADDPRTGAIVIAGDALVALGRYEDAKSAYASIQGGPPSPELIARLAYLDELEGNPDAALSALQEAAAIQRRYGGAGEPAAWFEVRIGDLYFNTGRYQDALDHYQTALKLFPDYYAALAAIGKSRAAMGDFDGGIEFYEEAIAVQPRLEVLWAVGDLYSLTGQTALANESYETIEAVAALSRGVYDRTLSLFYADHGQPTQALSLAQAGAQIRPDIFGYDTLAWALYRNGRYEEARTASDRALALGTRDARLLYHAGAISLALGDTERAVLELTSALSISPNFDPVQGDNARLLLEEASR